MTKEELAKAIREDYERKGIWAIKTTTLTMKLDFEMLGIILEALEEPKTGHWISHYDEDAKEGWYECDRCHTERAFNTKFCPDCGVKMIEPQESAYDRCPICVNRNKNCQFGSLDCHFEEQIDE